ncbi:hypothetical protein PV797_02615 [Clostridiaceae bacterium M8S5]|nr:hypothetical protein PV797_02615 [Clostridiaceae bacterium M8S5]
MKTKKIVNIFIITIQIMIIAVLAVLEYLSEYKAGIMHHLYYKKIEYLSTIYSQGAKIIHIGIVMLVTVLMMVLNNKAKNTGRRINIIWLLILNCLFVAMLYIPSLNNLNIYAHMLIGIEVMICLQIVSFLNKIK